MSILAGLYTGISGLQASGSALGIIGDNIANAGTTAYKASRGEFQDVIASNLKGILGGNQIGRGVRLAGVTSISLSSRTRAARAKFPTPVTVPSASTTRAA